MRPKEPEQPQDISYDSGGGGDEIIQDEPESKKVKWSKQIDRSSDQNWLAN